MKKIFLFFICLILISCMEENQDKFSEDTIIEAYLIVGEPIKNVRITHTIPILDTFKLENSVIIDAKVYVFSKNGDTIQLEYDNNNFYYHAINQNYLIKENEEYHLFVIVNNDTIIGKTFTPKSFKWIKRLPDIFQYPKDSILLNDIVKLSWENPGALNYYHVTVKCLDTLNYGIYLDPPIDELNRRVTLFGNRAYAYKNTTRHGLAPSNEGSMVWTSLQWYGMQEITIYNPDYNWFRWLGQYYQGEYNQLLSSVSGNKVKGVFGSATAIRDTFFILKNIR